MALAGLIVKEIGGRFENMGQALESKDGTIKEDKSVSGKLLGGLGGGGNMGETAGAVKDVIGAFKSDERLKELYGEKAPDLIECFKNIDAYMFKYKKEAQELYGKRCGVDDDKHVGVMAQELESNPATAAAVSTDENGYKEVDAKEMTLVNTAVLSEIAKKLDDMENRLNALEQRG